MSVVLDNQRRRVLLLFSLMRVQVLLYPVILSVEAFAKSSVMPCMGVSRLGLLW